MENKSQISNHSNQVTAQEQILDRVNQSYEKMVQHVKEMIHKNNEQLS
ncbi:hypothetical protein [Neobacillus fumarioli]|nr:hypothetical protein [Neobacillus fumarioli]